MPTANYFLYSYKIKIYFPQNYTIKVYVYFTFLLFDNMLTYCKRIVFFGLQTEKMNIFRVQLNYE